jgi:hypothetical protein
LRLKGRRGNAEQEVSRGRSSGRGGRAGTEDPMARKTFAPRRTERRGEPDDVKPVNKRPQMSKQLELPQATRSEALPVLRSEEAVTAGNAPDGSGTARACRSWRHATSTLRTAWCGPACQVVWQGTAGGFNLRRPYADPISSPMARRQQAPPDLAHGSPVGGAMSSAQGKPPPGVQSPASTGHPNRPSQAYGAGRMHSRLNAASALSAGMHWRRCD